MAYVTIPKDLSKVKNKVFLNLTKRQLVCMGFAAGMGVPFYFLMRDTLGTSNAAAGMVLLMLPEFFFALYEKNGMHLETILTNFISVRFKRPAVRRYEVENLYDRELETAAGRLLPEVLSETRKEPEGTAFDRAAFHSVSGNGARRYLPGGGTSVFQNRPILRH